MQVRELLKSKPDRIISVSPATTAVAAAKTLAENHIGVSVVLDDDKKLVGVISERDIVAAVSANDGKLEHLVVGQLMTQLVISCDLSDGVLVAIRKMYDHTIRHLVVMNGDRLAGVLSLRDILKAMFVSIEGLEKAVQEDDDADRLPPVETARSS